jgi:hypothetical protein
MAKNATEFLSLEASLTANIEEMIGELTYDESAVDLMDLSSNLVDSPARMVLNNSVGLALMTLHGVTEDDATARQSAYRAYVFAYASTQMVTAYNFELKIADYIQLAKSTDNPQATVLNDAEKYLAGRPMVSGYIDAFADELDVSGSGKWYKLVRSISGGIFKLAEVNMFDTYLDQRVADLK